MSMSACSSFFLLYLFTMGSSPLSAFSLFLLPFSVHLPSYNAFPPSLADATAIFVPSLAFSCRQFLKILSSTLFLSISTLSMTTECPQLKLLFLEWALLSEWDWVWVYLTNMRGCFFLRRWMLWARVRQTMLLSAALELLFKQTSFLICRTSLLSSMNFCRLQKRFLVRIWLRMALNSSFSYSVRDQQLQLVSVSSPLWPSSRKLKRRVSYCVGSLGQSFVQQLYWTLESFAQDWMAYEDGWWEMADYQLFWFGRTIDGSESSYRLGDGPSTAQISCCYCLVGYLSLISLETECRVNSFCALGCQSYLQSYLRLSFSYALLSTASALLSPIFIAA